MEGIVVILKWVKLAHTLQGRNRRTCIEPDGKEGETNLNEAPRIIKISL